MALVLLLFEPHDYLWIKQTTAEKHCPCFNNHLSGEKPNGKKKPCRPV
jgi:hypothetical protein